MRTSCFPKAGKAPKDGCKTIKLVTREDDKWLNELCCVICGAKPSEIKQKNPKNPKKNAGILAPHQFRCVAFIDGNDENHKTHSWCFNCAKSVNKKWKEYIEIPVKRTIRFDEIVRLIKGSIDNKPETWIKIEQQFTYIENDTLFKHGPHRNTLLYQCVDKQSMKMLICILHEIILRKQDKFILNKGRQFPETGDEEMTPLMKILMSLSKTTMKKEVQTRETYLQMIYLLILCGVNISYPSLIESQANKARNYQTCAPLHKAYILFMPHLFVALSLNHKSIHIDGAHEADIIHNIIHQLWNGSSLKENIIQCNDDTLSILSAALFYYHLKRNESFVMNTKHKPSIIAAGRTMTTYRKRIYGHCYLPKIETRKLEEKKEEKIIDIDLMEHIWPSPRIKPLKLLSLNIVYQYTQKRKGFRRFILYIPRFYNLCKLNLSTPSFDVFESKHCCDLFKRLQILCRNNYILQNVELNGFAINSESSASCAKWIRNWNTNCSNGNYHILRQLSLTNVRLDDEGVERLCDAILDNIDKLHIESLVLNDNPFTISGIYEICEMMNEEKMIGLKHLELLNLEYLYFDYGDYPIKSFLFNLSFAKDFKVLFNKDEKVNDSVNDADDRKECKISTNDEIFEFKQQYFDEQHYKTLKQNEKTLSKDVHRSEAILRSLIPNEKQWNQQIELMKTHCEKMTARIQQNVEFMMVDKRNWKMPQPNMSIESAHQSRKVCFLQPKNYKRKRAKTMVSPRDLTNNEKIIFYSHKEKLSCLRYLGRNTKIIKHKHLTELQKIDSTRTKNKDDETKLLKEKIKYLKKIFKENGIALDGLMVYTEESMDAIHAQFVNETSLKMNKLAKDNKAHSHEEVYFQETNDFIVYDSEHKYLWIHLETMQHCNVEIDLNIFDTLYIKYCYIDVAEDRNISLTLITPRKQLYIHHMLCIKGVKHLTLGSGDDKCWIKSAQIWLQQNEDIWINVNCRLSAITTWFYKCNNVVNSGKLLNISNCWINGGKKLGNKSRGCIKSYGYLYLNMNKITNKNLIESDILYHVEANQYSDTDASITTVPDTIYFNIYKECTISGKFTTNSWLLNAEKKLVLSSDNKAWIDRTNASMKKTWIDPRIKVRRLFYIKCENGKFINNENVLIGSDIISNDINMDLYKIYGCHETAFQFAQYTTKESALRINANTFNIESGSGIQAKHLCEMDANSLTIDGEIESNALLLNINTLSITSDNLFIERIFEIKLKERKELKEAILLNDGDILMKPRASDEDDKIRTECMLTVDESNIFIKNYTITTKHEDCTLNIGNIDNVQFEKFKIETHKDLIILNLVILQIKSSSIIAEKLSFKNIDKMQMDKDAVIEYKTLFRTENVNRFIMNADTYLSIISDDDHSFDVIKDKKCVIETNDLFSMQQGSNITAHDEYFAIRCGGKVEVDGAINIKERSLFEVYANDLEISANGQITSELVPIDPEKLQQLKQIQPSFTENHLTQDTANILQNCHYLHLFTKNTMHLFGTIEALKSLVVIDSLDHIHIDQNSNIKAQDIFIRGINTFNIESGAGIQAAHLCEIVANSLTVNGEIESNQLLLLNFDTLSIASNNLFIESKFEIKLKEQKEAILLNDGDILMKPRASDEDDEIKTECMLTVDKSNVFIKNYTITADNEDCTLNIRNMDNVKFENCEIELYDMHLSNIQLMELHNNTNIKCDVFIINDVNYLKVLDESQLIMQQKEAIINVNHLFFVDKHCRISSICAYVEINSKCDIKIDGEVYIEKDCQFNIKCTETLTLSETCKFKSESKTDFNPSEAKTEESDDINHETIITQYMKHKSRKNHYVYLHSDKQMHVDGEYIGEQALYIMECEDSVNISGVLNMNVLFVKCNGCISFNKLCTMNGKCYFDANKQLNISDAKLQSNNNLILLNSNEIKIKSSSITAEELLFKNINKVQMEKDAVIEYKTVFHTLNVDRFIMNAGSYLSIISHADDSFDAVKDKKCIIETNDEFSMQQESNIRTHDEYFEIRCGGKVEIGGDINIKEMSLFQLYANDLEISANGQITSELVPIDPEKLQQLKRIQPSLTENHLTQDTANILQNSHYLHLFIKNTMHLFGTIEALKSLVVIDSMDHIHVNQNSNIKAQDIFIRCINTITIEGSIVSETGKCIINTNNRLYVNKYGEIDAVFLDLYGVPEDTSECPNISADNLDLVALVGKLEKIEDAINECNRTRDSKLSVLKTKLQNADEALKNAITQVNAAVDQTGLDEKNILPFLRKMSGLPNITIHQKEQLIILNEKLQSFIVLMQREFDYKLNMQTYFENVGLSKYVDILHKAGIKELDDLCCKNEKTFESKILSKLPTLKLRTKNKIKKLCLKPDKTWKMVQDKKAKVLLENSKCTSKILASFFGDIHALMQKKQKAALKSIQQKPKDLTVVSKNKNASKSIADDTLGIALKLRQEHKKEEEEKQDNIAVRRAFNVVTGVENCCSKMIRQQIEMEQSVVSLANILQHKPEEFKLDVEESTIANIWNFMKSAVTTAEPIKIDDACYSSTDDDAEEDEEKGNVAETQNDTKDDKSILSSEIVVSSILQNMINNMIAAQEQKHAIASMKAKQQKKKKKKQDDEQQKKKKLKEEQKRKAKEEEKKAKEDKKRKTKKRKERKKKEKETNKELLFCYLKKQGIKDKDVKKFKQWIEDNKFDIDWIKKDVGIKDETDQNKKKNENKRQNPAAPYMCITSLPTNAKINQSVKFKASKAHDCDHYLWNFGDGTKKTTKTPQVSNTYREANVYPVTVTVIDKYGKTATAGLNQRVYDPQNTKNSLSPYATITSNKTTQEINETVTFDASKSHDDREKKCSRFVFDFGDGSRSVSTARPKTQHRYDKKGSYPVSVTVSDKDGQTSEACLTQRIVDSDQQDVTLPYVAIESTPKHPKAHDAITFDASKCVDCDGESCKKYMWDFGDDSAKKTTTKPVIIHKYAKTDTYTVTVTVTDKYDKSVAATCTIMVIASEERLILPPAVFLKSIPNESVPIEAVYFDASDSHNYKGESCVSFRWDFGDGSDKITTDEPRVKHSYRESGTYLVTVMATEYDNDDDDEDNIPNTVKTKKDDDSQQEELNLNQAQKKENNTKEKERKTNETEKKEDDKSGTTTIETTQNKNYDDDTNKEEAVAQDQTTGNGDNEQNGVNKQKNNTKEKEKQTNEIEKKKDDKDGKIAIETTQNINDEHEAVSVTNHKDGTVSIETNNQLQKKQNNTKPKDGTIPMDQESDNHHKEDAVNKENVTDDGDNEDISSDHNVSDTQQQKSTKPKAAKMIIAKKKASQKKQIVITGKATVNQRVREPNGVDPCAALLSKQSTSLPSDAVHFDASESVDHKGNECKQFLWDFGDHSTPETTMKPVIEHVYNEPGSYHVNVTVADQDNNKSNASLTQCVKAPKDTTAPLYVTLESKPKITKLKQNVHFSCQSHDAQNNMQYVWDFGDRTPRKTTDKPHVDHQYRKAGTYPVTVEVFGAYATCTQLVIKKDENENETEVENKSENENTNENESVINQHFPTVYKQAIKFMAKLKAKPLWNIVDDGVANVLVSDITAIKISINYFGFFGQFKESFTSGGGLLSSGHLDIKGLESLTKQIKEFEVVRTEFEERMNEMETVALKSAGALLKKTPSAPAFKRAQKNRKTYSMQYENAQRNLNKKEGKLDKEINSLYVRRNELMALKESLSAAPEPST